MTHENFLLGCYEFWEIEILGAKEWFFDKVPQVAMVERKILGGVIQKKKFPQTLFSALFGQKSDIFAKMTPYWRSKWIDIPIKNLR